MVEEYLAFARGESAEYIETTNIAAILRDVVNGLRLNETPITITTKDGVFIPIKPNGFKRAVTNLISNAIFYGQKVVVELTEIPGAIQISVDDDGPGIPLEEREDVFKPFYRLDSARSPDSGGSGLGLNFMGVDVGARLRLHYEDGRVRLGDKVGDVFRLLGA